MHDGFYGHVARGRFGTVSYFNMDDHHQHKPLCVTEAGQAVFGGDMSKWSWLRNLVTVGSPDGSGETTDAELM